MPADWIVPPSQREVRLTKGLREAAREMVKGRRADAKSSRRTGKARYVVRESGSRRIVRGV